ncbi:MAG: hypothetical protein RL497_1805 [Pseudomonadota bacterium]|jgi:translocation and assembly module TamA
MGNLLKPQLLTLMTTAVLWLYTPHSAAQLPPLKFWAEQHPFSIDVLPSPQLTEELRQQLKETLQQQLKKERQINAELLELNETNSLAQYEITLLERILRSQGYFSAQVSIKNTRALNYQVEPGLRFFITQLILDLPETTQPLPALSITQGEPLVADAVFNALEEIKNHYRTHACYYPLEVKYQASIDKTTATAQVRIYLESTTNAHFDASNFHGAPAIKKDFLQHYLTYQAGDCFKQPLLDKMRLNLLKSDLLTSADVQTHLNGQAVITDIYLTPRKPRTIKGGLSYDGDNKEGLSLGWEHRNIGGGGEHLGLVGEQNRIKGNYQARLTLPHILHPQQNLIISTQYKPEDSASSQSKTEIISASLERYFSEYTVANLGIETEFIQEKGTEFIQENQAIYEEKNTRRSGLFSLPVHLRLNNTDQPLNPTQGWALSLGASSVWDAYHPEIQFQQQNFAASAYYTHPTKTLHPTLAVRAASGTISGESLNTIPATKRFYVGGGGSVRGYPYQTLGAIVEGKPSGGLSFAEASFELRLRWGEDWGLAAFYDGGWAYPDDHWHWGEQFLWGYGLGLRYYTLFAPIRLDVARPKTPRPGDDPYQIYVSLGQAF